ncbi:MAG: UDP-N-acetylmuramoyl-L-alanine--D-glutamate ligase [Rhodocyclaceae bacterium]|nr:UDP-N-acetylmuramoyl-L-alanine--D-glutamate ligase [Rhodocyclaceae bacterium]
MDLRGKHVLILGLGESGLASARWCARQGARVRVADTRASPPGLDELKRRLASADFHTGEFAKSLLEGINLLVLSPGLSGGLMIVIHARAQGIPVVGEIELFAQALRDLKQHVPVLAITGTNGKTTTTTLTGHLIASTGRSVGVAGNISPAALTALMDFQDTGALPQAWVLELSSFQLETTETLNATAATVLNISDDHLDRYIDLDDYASAKARIFAGSGVQVLNRQDARVKRMAIPGRKLITFGIDAPADANDFGLRENRGEQWLVQGSRFLMPVSELPIAGLHNAANALAALALCAAIDIDPVALLPALRAFRGLPHRVEKVAEIADVTWYDDSKGTNVGATVAALQGLGGVGCKSVVILGGDGKGQDFAPLKPAVAAHARAVVLIGRDGPAIGLAIDGCGVPLLNAADMDTAVQTAAAHAQPGDAVLLSPACASYDMFRNYEHRAAAFKAAVQSLVKPS